MDRTSISYTQRSGITPETEIGALSACYRFIIDSHAKKRGCLLDKTGPDDAKLRSTKGVSDVEQQPR